LEHIKEAVHPLGVKPLFGDHRPLHCIVCPVQQTVSVNDDDSLIHMSYLMEILTDIRP